MNSEVSRWPHRLAVMVCCATFPLVWVGGLVTTYKAGMAVPDWPNTYGYNLFLYPLETWIYGPWDLFIEHGHRLFASLVGLLTMALCLSLWATRQPRWLRVMGVVALAGVVFQGVLGGMRVLLDERTLAMIHGCVGPAFFAFTAALAVLTSRTWRTSRHSIADAKAAGLRVLAVATPLLAYLQLMLGAQLRHFPPDQSPRLFHAAVWFHILVAMALAFQILVTAVVAWRRASGVKQLMLPAASLVLLVVVQLALGGATWIVKYGPPPFLSGIDLAAAFTVEAQGWWQAQITTAHVAVGSLILAVSTVLALHSIRVIKPQAIRAAMMTAPSRSGANVLGEVAS